MTSDYSSDDREEESRSASGDLVSDDVINTRDPRPPAGNQLTMLPEDATVTGSYAYIRKQSSIMSS